MRRVVLGIAYVLLSIICMNNGYAEEEWKEFKSRHFTVYYQQAPKDFVETVSESAEENYREITRSLGFIRYSGWTFDDRAKIYIYNNANHYVESSRVYQWSHGVASPTDRIIRTYPAAHGFFDSTLPHELTHILFREFIGFDIDVPLWFEEGVAMSQEKAKRWGADTAVKAAYRDEKFIPVKELAELRPTHNTSVERVQLFYAQSASLINYLIRTFGEKRFERFCRELKKGKSFEWTMRKVYVRIKDYDDLSREWLEYLELR